MRKYIGLFFSVLLFCACRSVPNGIIDPDEMVGLLTEVHIDNAELGSIAPVPDTLYKYGTGRYLATFRRFHTDSAQFTRSYRYYTLHPAVFADIYGKVLKSLSAKSDSITKLIAKYNTTHNKTNNRSPVQPNAAAPRPFGVNTGFPHKPPVPVNRSPNARAAFERLQAHRDSLLKRK